MPLVNRTFNQLIDFTRTTAGTYVDSTGKIVNTPASRNLLTFTQQFDNAAWTKSNATVTANTSVAPDGTSTADKVIATNTASAYRAVGRGITLTATGYVYSIYAKAAEYSLLRVADSNGGRLYASFDLSNGTVVGGSTGGTQFTSASVTAVGSGWYRCIVVFTGTAATYSLDFAGYPAGATLNAYGVQYAGDGNSGVLAWGAQLEANSTATDYTRNVGGVFPPRFDYDPVTLAPRGLLIEEQRVNLFTYSEFSNGLAGAPTRGGLITTTTFSGLTGTTGLAFGHDGSTTSFAYKDGSVNGTTYAISAFVRMDDGNAPVFGSTTNSDPANTFAFVVGGTAISPTTYVVTNFGGGLYRVSATGTAGTQTGNNGIVKYNTNNSRTFKVSGYQLEAASFATSYIPTVASQVTRAADVAAITGPNFTPWYRQDEGTFVAEYDGATGGYAAAVNDGGTNNYQGIVLQTGTTVRGVTTAAGVYQFVQNTVSAVTAVNKTAYAYQLNNLAASSNGGPVATNTSATIPLTMTQMGVGTYGGFGFLNGHIRSIRFYPSRLTNAQLQALTA